MTGFSTRATGSLSSFDPESRTVDAVLATETPVRRRDFEGAFDEVLVCNREAIDAVRLESMAVLDSHQAFGLDARLGSVVAGSLRFERGAALVKIKLSRNDKAEAIFRDLEDGHRLSVSVGYQLLEIERSVAPAGGVAVVRATRWQPMELSLVNVPADPSATTRAEPHEETTMTAETSTITRAERKRIKDINTLAVHMKLSPNGELVSRAIDDGQTLDEFRAAVIEHQINQEERSHTFPHSTMRGMHDERETRRRLASNAILHRYGVTTTLEDGARQYRGLDTITLMRNLLVTAGQDGGGSPAEVIERSLHTTSDFPVVMSAVVHATLAENYEAAAETFSLISNRNTVADLREVKVIEMGEGPQLEKITEKGEYKRGTVKESEEGFSMAHYGKVFGLTEKMLINDQLGAFTRLIANWGRQVARLEGDIVWNTIFNARLTDGKTLFHADHNNIATAAALSKDALIVARKLFRKQTDLDGNLINISPRFLFVGTENEVTAQTLTQATTTPQTPDQTIPEAIRSLTPVYEPRIDKLASDKAWFLFASTADSIGPRRAACLPVRL